MTLKLVILVCAVVAQCANASPDLSTEMYWMTSDITPDYSPVKPTDIKLNIMVLNKGLDLHSTLNDTPHFTAKGFFADNVEAEKAEFKSELFDLTIPGNQASRGFANAGKVNITGMTGTVKVGREDCFKYNYFCVQIYPSDELAEGDTVENNDFCLEVGHKPPSGPGHLHCTDLVLKSFKVEKPENNTFKPGQPVKVKLSMSVQNVGPVDLPVNKARDNYGLYVYFEGPEGIQELGPLLLDDRNLTRAALNGIHHPTNPNNTISVTGADFTVNMDNGCKNYEELCMRLQPGLYTKSEEDENEDLCVPLTKEGAGTKDCSKLAVVVPDDKTIDPEDNTDDGNQSNAAMATVSITAILFSLASTTFM